MRVQLEKIRYIPGWHGNICNLKIVDKQRSFWVFLIGTFCPWLCDIYKLGKPSSRYFGLSVFTASLLWERLCPLRACSRWRLVSAGRSYPPSKYFRKHSWMSSSKEVFKPQVVLSITKKCLRFELESKTNSFWLFEGKIWGFFLIKLSKAF